MPPEPLNWDNKDVIAHEKKQEIGAPIPDGGSTAGFSSVSRWRESYQGVRDWPSPSPRRPPLGHYRQSSGIGGSADLRDETSDHGCTPSRSEDDSFRIGNGGYVGRNGNGRESRGSLQQSPRNSVRPLPNPHDSFTHAHRSAADVVTRSSSQPLPVSNHHDKTGGGVADGSGIGLRCDRERDRDNSLGSIAWKPVMWSRSASFSSSSKIARSESGEGRLEVTLPTGKETPVRSPMKSPPPSEEGPRKKQRLGWGQGLAKYEKQKVEGPEDSGMKNRSVPSSNVAKTNHSDASPKLDALVGSASPATPSSVACSSSRGMEGRTFTKAANNDITSQVINSPVHGFENYHKDLFNKVPLEYNYISNLSSQLADLLQPEDASSGDSNFTKTTLSKILLIKIDVLKVLEKTEGDIDLLEVELKNLNGEPEKYDPRENAIVSQAVTISKTLEDPVKVASKVITTSKNNCDPSSATSLLEESLEHNGALEISHLEVAGQDFNSPETVTSRTGKPDLADKVATHGSTSKGEGEAHDLDKNPAVVYGDTYGTRSGIDGSVTALIIASNRDSAKKASEIFHNALPVGVSQFDAWGSNFISTLKKDLRIKEKLAMRKSFLRFKARVLSLKYRAFNHLWKEDLRLISIRKHRSKTQKRFDLNCRLSQNASQKHGPTVHLRFMLPGNSTLAPTTEIFDFTSKLLSDAKIKLYRSNLKMPALILDERERKHSRFISNNGLIEDPCTFEKERTMINPWSPEEKEVFLEKLAIFGKDFGEIASCLDHKTTADCVEFYYKNHKSASFEQVKKNLKLRKQWRCLPTNTYLVASGKKRQHEINAASPDLLGEQSVMVANSNGNTRVQQRVPGRPTFGARAFKISGGNYGASERASSVEISGHEKTLAAELLAGMCGTVSSEAMSSCITSSVGPMEKVHYVSGDQPLTSEVTQSIDDEETCSGEGCGELDSVDWTDDEKSIFIKALSSYGKDFARISRCLGTRSREQCKIFFSKARKCLGLDGIHQGPGNEGATPLSDANGGRSDTEDACLVEMDSTVCSTQSSSKVDVESVVNNRSDGLGHSGSVPRQIDRITSNGQCDVGLTVQEQVEKLESLINNNDNKSVTRKEIALCEQTREDVPNARSGYNASGGLHEIAYLCGNIEVKKQENYVADSACEFYSTEGLDMNERLSSRIAVETQQEGVVRTFPDNELKTKLKSEQCVMAAVGLEDAHSLKTCSGTNNRTSPQVFAADYDTNGTTGHPGNNASLCPNVFFIPNYHRQISIDMLPFLQKKPQIISWKQKENSASRQLNPSSSDQSSIRYEEHCNEGVQSTINFEEHGPKRHLSSLSGDVYQQYFSGKRSLNPQDQPANILRGYPLRLLNKKEMHSKSDMVCKKSVLPQLHLKKCENPQSDQVTGADMNGEKPHGCAPSQLGSGLPCNGKGDEHLDGQLRPCSWSDCSETEEHSVRTGDVKLFGQILSPPSSLQKACSSSHESDERPPSPKLSNSSSASLSNGKIDATKFASRPGANCYMDPSELPMRSYGFWDGNKIQTGLSSLPESAMVLANYTGALTGVSYYPTKDSSTSNRVLTDFGQAYIPSYTYDRKHQDVLPDACKRNGFETVPCSQQQGSVGKDRVRGASGIMVGGGCTGISDPVVAIKMHYAGRAGVHGSEEESWRDVGRR